MEDFGGLVDDIREQVEGPATFEDLFPPGFMREYTEYSDIESFCRDSPIAFESATETEVEQELQSSEWDGWVQENTLFPNWDTMLETAADEELQRRLDG